MIAMNNNLITVNGSLALGTGLSSLLNVYMMGNQTQAAFLDVLSNADFLGSDFLGSGSLRFNAGPMGSRGGKCFC